MSLSSSVANYGGKHPSNAQNIKQFVTSSSSGQSNWTFSKKSGTMSITPVTNKMPVVIDNDLYVTGNIGDARAGLENILESKRVDLRNQFTRSFVSPIARVELAKQLTKHVTSMIDISDGLYNEIKTLAKCSGKGFIIDSNKIPISTGLKKKYKHRSVEIAFTGGEDYELLFTLPKGLDGWITKLSKKFSVKISKIGYCTSNKSIKLLNYHGEKLEQKTYDHFRK